MKTQFKFVGLERLNNEHYMSATCEPLDKEETFKALIAGDNDRKEALWNFVKGDWGASKIANVEHDGFYEDGLTPKNPVITSIEYHNS